MTEEQLATGSKLQEKRRALEKLLQLHTEDKGRFIRACLEHYAYEIPSEFIEEFADKLEQDVSTKAKQVKEQFANL